MDAALIPLNYQWMIERLYYENQVCVSQFVAGYQIFKNRALGILSLGLVLNQYSQLTVGSVFFLEENVSLWFW